MLTFRMYTATHTQESTIVFEFAGKNQVKLLCPTNRMESGHFDSVGGMSAFTELNSIGVE